MERKNSNADDDSGEELATTQMKIKAQVRFHVLFIQHNINVHGY